MVLFQIFLIMLSSAIVTIISFIRDFRLPFPILIIITIIRVFCPRAGPSLQAQEPRLQFYQGLNRYGGYPFLSGFPVLSPYKYNNKKLMY